MHLKQLKLAGFKSFVDPAVVPFPSQLVAVVGPNGCGKSNIIDAVRWVMGESSAKNLRGEAMTDVIFNGSSGRKPVGQASVELVFDNSLGRIGGAYAQYAEVAVKRVVTRDGESSYYLNGSRCRRRDITDIFLGTGAGAKGYSIIGQGTISKLIEARPEELRLFLEEAAGVSKYKERRRETVQRMEQTRDNLARVEDIRMELGKQLERLERQAKAAERYTELKAQEKQCKAEILALKWRDLTSQQQAKQQQIHSLNTSLEGAQSLLTEVDSQKLIQVEQLNQLTDSNQQLQNRFYQSGTEMARLEESLQQRQREQQRLHQELAQLAIELTELRQRHDQDQQSHSQGEEQVLIAEARWQSLQVTWESKQQEGTLLGAEKTSLENQWQETQRQLTQARHQHQQQQLQQSHLAQKKQDIQIRLEKMQQEVGQQDIEGLQATVLNLQQQEQMLQAQQEADATQLNALQAEEKDLATALFEASKALDIAQDEWQKLRVEHAALQASQRASTLAGREKSDRQQARLFESLQVEPRWQKACEQLLADRLQALVLPDWPREPWAEAGESLVMALPAKSQSDAGQTLADVMKGLVPAMQPSLDSIHLADDLTTAWAMIERLAPGHSVLTPAGDWLGQGWLCAAPVAEEDAEGLLARQQRLNQLGSSLAAAEQGLADLKQQREQLQKQRQDKQIQLAVAKERLAASKEACQANQNALAVKQQQLAFIQRQQDLAAQEQADLQHALEDILTQQIQLDEQLNLGQAQAEEWAEREAILDEQRRASQLQYQAFQQVTEQLREESRQAEKAFDLCRNEQLRLGERIAHQAQALQRLLARQTELQTQQQQSSEPEESLQAQLSLKLLEYQALEAQLTESREQISLVKLGLEDLDARLRQQQQSLRQVEDQINALKLQEQELAVRANGILEAMQEMAVQFNDLMGQIGTVMTVAGREADLLQLTDRIKRLGAINLAAIEEYQLEGERKRYLDSQHADLTAALLALEEAMQQIDTETTNRFSETYEAVNERFQQLFPRLFGGGRAQLQLTCDNLLEAGILVMAQPPGKRNSTIHLLSGGEKAMTAVALVFAIFQLNPSPFCMLDEVDAPLDDVNVGRFCEMVKEMSQFVQFLFITHNKVTMEMAEHLIGVTMREPGVSRLVAVDVQQALTME